MGWTNQVVQASEVIIGGAPDVLLVYDGAPAAGNLIASIAGEPGTDPFGDAVKQYITAYGASGSYVQMAATAPATLRVGTGDAAEATPGLVGTAINGTGTGRYLSTEIVSPRLTGTPNTLSALFLSSQSPDLTIEPFAQLTAGDSTDQCTIQVNRTNIQLSGAGPGPIGGTFFTVDMLASQVTAGYPVYYSPAVGSTPPNDWVAGGLINGWANNASFGAFRYRAVACPPNNVEITGVINATAATLPTFSSIPFSPKAPGGYAVGCNAGNGGATSIANLRWDTSGNLSIANTAALPVAGAFFIKGFIPLSAT